MRRTQYEDECWAAIQHLIKISKAIDVKDRLIRLKKRIFNIDDLLNEDKPKGKKRKGLTIIPACRIVYDRIAVGKLFSGLKFCNDVRLLIGRKKAYNSSILRKLRDLRDPKILNEINYISIGAKFESMYKKLPVIGDKNEESLL